MTYHELLGRQSEMLRKNIQQQLISKKSEWTERAARLSSKANDQRISPKKRMRSIPSSPESDLSKMRVPL